MSSALRKPRPDENENTAAAIVDPAALDILFRDARTHFKWLDRPVEDAVLRAVYELASLGPTSANSQPARFVFVKTPKGKEKLRPALAPMNLDKTMTAPVTAIVGHDLRFYEKFDRTFPHADARAWFEGNAPLTEISAFRNGTLQAAYLIVAARAHGLDAGPMSGFDNNVVDAAFFPEGTVKSNFLINLGYGDSSVLFPRLYRLPFDEAARIV